MLIGSMAKGVAIRHNSRRTLKEVNPKHEAGNKVYLRLETGILRL